jgi:precorrin-6B methylase 2
MRILPAHRAALSTVAGSFSFSPFASGRSPAVGGRFSLGSVFAERLIELLRKHVLAGRPDTGETRMHRYRSDPAAPLLQACVHSGTPGEAADRRHGADAAEPAHAAGAPDGPDLADAAAQPEPLSVLLERVHARCVDALARDRTDPRIAIVTPYLALLRSNWEASGVPRAQAQAHLAIMDASWDQVVAEGGGQAVLALRAHPGLDALLRHHPAPQQPVDCWAPFALAGRQIGVEVGSRIGLAPPVAGERLVQYEPGLERSQAVFAAVLQDLAAWLHPALAGRPSIAVLDVACGWCDEAPVLIDRLGTLSDEAVPVTVTGIEYEGERIAQARTTHAALGERCVLIAGDASRLGDYPQIPAEADLVVIRRQQVTDGAQPWERILEQAVDRLRPGGAALITSISFYSHQLALGELAMLGLEVVANQHTRHAEEGHTMTAGGIGVDNLVALLKKPG